MKNSIDKPKQEGQVQTICSEETCATCFQNRGCIYEQLGAAIRKIQEAKKEDGDVNHSVFGQRA